MASPPPDAGGLGTGCAPPDAGGLGTGCVSPKNGSWYSKRANVLRFAPERLPTRVRLELGSPFTPASTTPATSSRVRRSAPWSDGRPGRRLGGCVLIPHCRGQVGAADRAHPPSRPIFQRFKAKTGARYRSLGSTEETSRDFRTGGPRRAVVRWAAALIPRPIRSRPVRPRTSHSRPRRGTPKLPVTKKDRQPL
jgi:hypothetical protein